MSTPRYRSRAPPLKGSSPSRSGFMVMEMLGAMAILVLTVALFHSALRQLRSLETLAMTQNRALIVLENVLERLEAEPRVTGEVATAVLDAEFAASPLNIPDRFSASCVAVDGRLRLQIVRADQRPVALVELAP